MKRVVCLGLAIALLMCSACGGQAEQESLQEEIQIDYVREYQSQSPVDICNVAWQSKEVMLSETPFTAESYTAPVFENNEKRRWDDGKCTVGEHYVSLFFDSVDAEDDNILFYKRNRINLTTLKAETVPYTFLRSQGTPVAISYSNGVVYGMFEIWDQNDMIQTVYIAPLLEDGSLGERIDITSIVREKALLPAEPNYIYSCTFQVCKEKQVVYMIPFDGQGLYVFDMAGQLEYEFTGFDDSGEVAFFANTWQGDSLFLSYDRQAGETIYFCYENKGVKELYKEPGDKRYLNMDLATCDAYGNILYLEMRSHLVSWNVVTGERQRLVLNASDTMTSLASIARNREGKIVVLRDDMAGLSENVYSTREPAEETTLTLETSCFWDMSLKDRISAFERTHPGITMQLGKEVDNSNQDRGRVDTWYGQMLGGGGPDMMYVICDEAMRLAKAGSLMDLSGVIDPKEYNLQEGLLECGQVGGKQYFFPTVCYVDTILVKRSVWDKPTWTVEEALDAFEKLQRDNPEAYFLGQTGGYNRWWNLLEFFIHDITHSPFLDTETMTASFDGELFQRVLELCKEQDALALRKNIDLNKADLLRAINSQEALAILPIYQTFGIFSEFCAGLDEDTNYVGYPTTGKSGNLLYGSAGMVVNANATGREQICDFLKSLYQYDFTMVSTYCVPLRRDLAADCILENLDWNTDSTVAIKIGNRTFTSVKALKRDGSSFKREYLAFLDSCVPKETAFDEVKNIVMEEAEAYFEGDKTVEQVQRLIQDRVSLYLSEEML